MKSSKVLVDVAIVAALILVIIVPLFLYETTTATDVLVVDDKFSAMTSNGPEKIIYSGDLRYQVDDDVLRLHNNSDEIFESMEIGDTYQIDTVGWNLPFLDMYPNIIGVTELS